MARHKTNDLIYQISWHRQRQIIYKVVVYTVHAFRPKVKEKGRHKLTLEIEGLKE
jgi:hypothetical protein